MSKLTPEETHEQILRYLEGELTAEEASAFEQQMDGDSDLRKEVDVFRKVIQGIHAASDQQLRAEIAGTFSANHSKGKTRSIGWMWASVAAVVVTGVLVYELTRDVIKPGGVDTPIFGDSSIYNDQHEDSLRRDSVESKE